MATQKEIQIETSLSGKVYTASKYPLIFGLIFGGVFFLIGAGLFLARMLSDSSWEWGYILLTAGAVVASAMGFLAAAFYWRVYKIVKKIMPDLLKNGIRLRAYSELRDVREGLDPNLGEKTTFYQIEVTFDYDNGRKAVLSRHLPGLKSYVGREISILYSPKHNEVFILKDEEHT